MKKAFLRVVSLSILLVFYQNCTFSNVPFSSSSFESKATLSASGGNGDIYDGKGKFERRVPGHTCQGEFKPHSLLQLENGRNPELITNTDEECGKVTEVDSDDIVKSENVNLIGYKKGIYADSSEIPEDAFVEVWCRDVESDKSRELVIQWNKPGEMVSAKFFDPAFGTNGSSVFEMMRSLSPRGIDYIGNLPSGDGLHLRIDRELSYPDSSHELVGYVNTKLLPGYPYPTKMACRLGGQFDPEAPKFEYDFSNNVFSVGQDIGRLQPQVNKNVLEYTIDPVLPKGLLFDQATGAIYGTPLELTSSQNYVITARLKFGYVSERLSLGVGRIFSIDSDIDEVDKNFNDHLCATSSGKCTLRAAVQEANQNPDTPIIIKVPSGTYTLSLGEIPIQSDIQLEGENDVVIDADFQSRHFDLHTGSQVKMSHLKLVNGVANGEGGSIRADGSSLSLNDIHFENNRTAIEDSRGGALFLNHGSLDVRSSRFSNNRTPFLSGSNLRGGAIYAYFMDRVKILDSIFTNNQSSTGGAVWISQYSGEITHIKNATFIENQAAVDGGALFIRGGTSILENLKINRNISSFAGAVRLDGFRDIWLLNSEFHENIGRDGLAVDLDGATNSIARIYETQFVSNERIHYDKPYDIRKSIVRTRLNYVRMRNTVFRDNENMLDSCEYTYESLNILDYGFHDFGGNIFDQAPCKFVGK